MNTLIILLSILLGGTLLFVCGDILVENAKRIALRFKIDPIVIGLTIVAFGTSAPELFVSVQSAWGGKSDIALGNVVGSNIVNILLILGVSAAISAIRVTRRSIQKDIPIMVGVSLLMLLLSLDLVISRIDGALLFILLISYIFFELKTANNLEDADVVDPLVESISSTSTLKIESLGVIGSLIGLMAGSKLLIYGATEIALYMGISQLVIGLTIVAVGTSLPELITSCIAAKKGESAIALGNIIGSNIFNILGVLGISSILSPIPVPLAALSFDIPIMIFSSLICVPIIVTENKITKGEGLMLLAYYSVYIIYLTLLAKEHATIPIVSEIMLVFVLPFAAFYYFRNKS